MWEELPNVQDLVILHLKDLVLVFVARRIHSVLVKTGNTTGELAEKWKIFLKSNKIYKNSAIRYSLVDTTGDSIKNLYVQELLLRACSVIFVRTCSEWWDNIEEFWQCVDPCTICILSNQDADLNSHVDCLGFCQKFGFTSRLVLKH